MSKKPHVNHAEQDIRLLAHALRSIAECVVITDMDERIKFVNDAFIKVYGYPEQELIGQHINIVRPQDGQQKLFEEISTSTTHGGWQGELMNRAKDGRLFPVALNTSVVLDERRQPIARMAVSVDITDRRRAEELVRLSEESYRGLFNTVSDAIYVQATDGSFLDVNRGAEEMYGYPREFFIGKTPLVLSAEGMNDIDETLRKVGLAFNGEPQRFEWWGRRSNGEVFPKEVRLNRGKYFGQDVIIALARDITARKRSEQALQDSEERYRLLFETNPHPMWAYDLENLHFLAVNEAAIRHYGYSREEFLSMTIKDIRPQEDVSRLLDNVAHVTEGLDQAGVWRHKKKNGDVIDVEIISHTLNFGGRSAELVLAMDITERHSLQRQLLQAQKLESIGTLASGIAHDINNILTIITGYASLIPGVAGDPEKLKKSVGVITESVRRGAALVEQILTFARKTEMRREVLNANAKIGELARLLGETFPRTITLSLDLDPSLPDISMDPNQFHQALLNLCVNARDAMMGEGTMTLSTRVVDGHRVARHFPRAALKPYVAISVQDTGTGMSEAVKSRIFDPFFTTKEKGKGTGLGLAVVFGIVEAHQGFIQVDSTPNSGSAFTMYLPVTLEQPKERSEGSATSHPAAAVNTQILVVEDEPALSDMLIEFLTRHGFRVLVAPDGVLALRIFREKWQTIDLVLSDVGLPGLDGMGVFRGLREIDPNAACVLASGYLDPELQSKMRHEGILGFVQKPYELHNLERVLREALASHRGHAGGN
ncbi:MAG: hypothetical protein A3H45_02050 [Ignavibacteria bacterium RIFCSPLOWO2_02_FULL_55_14]|nr:MAG: hypothetical protein A3H45_02050 [Ignavibacteria bacterium RIFCSPLOWO2_02_FULL_55_14]